MSDSEKVVLSPVEIDAKAQRLIKTIQRKGIRFVGALHDGERAAAPSAKPAVQDVTFCKTADGVHLAIEQSGNGLPLVKCATG